MAELVDAGDSKSPAARCAGSSPASGTISCLKIFYNNGIFGVAIKTGLEFKQFYEIYTLSDGNRSPINLGHRFCSG